MKKYDLGSGAFAVVLAEGKRSFTRWVKPAHRVVV